MRQMNKMDKPMLAFVSELKIIIQLLLNEFVLCHIK
jgi:hypothetical protein